MEKKIVYKLLLYLLMMSSVLAVLNTCFQNPISKRFSSSLSELIRKGDEVESITIGRSHGGALNYDFCDLKGVNLSVGGRDMATSYFLLKHLTDELTNLQEVNICISYSSFYFDNTSLSNGNLNDARKSIYSAVPIKYGLISKDDYNNFVFGKLFTFMRSDYGFNELKGLIIRKNNIRSSEGIDNQELQKTDTLSIYQSAKIQAYDHSKDRYIALNYNKKVIEENTTYLKNIIILLQRKGIKVNLFTPPYHSQYTLNFPKDDIIEMKNIVKEMMNNYKINYYDYSEYKRISRNYNMFRNADHMNDSGKEVFSKMFNKELIKTSSK